MDLIARALSAAFAVALAGVSACASEVSPPAEGNQAELEAEPAAQAPPGPAAATSRPTSGERRCGWLHNPTPGNWWLLDRDGEWVLGTQGGRQAPGMDEMPDMTRLGWVEVNGHYGYGCACMTLGVDPATRQVMRIDSATPRPLRQCRADPGLPRP
jgi:uncharacterized protein DUF4087